MTNSLAGEVEVWGDHAMRDKVWVEKLPDLPFEEVAAVLNEQPEVLGVEPGDVRAFPSFLLMGAPAETLTAYGPLAQDPGLLRVLREEQGVVVSERLARQRGLGLGDPVLIQTSGHGVQEFRVAAISDAYGYFLHPDERAYGLVHTDHMERFFCLDGETTSMIAVRMTKSDRTLVETVLRERFPTATGIRLYDGPGILAILLADIRRDFLLFDIILFLTGVLAALGVLNGQLLVALERKKELGVLRALGMTRGQVTGAVLLESGVLGLCGGLLGLVVGTGLTPVLVSALRILSGLPLPLRTAGPFLAFSMAGALLLAIAAGLYPIWRMNRLDAVQAVRTG